MFSNKHISKKKKVWKDFEKNKLFSSFFFYRQQKKKKKNVGCFNLEEDFFPVFSDGNVGHWNKGIGGKRADIDD